MNRGVRFAVLLIRDDLEGWRAAVREAFFKQFNVEKRSGTTEQREQYAGAHFLAQIQQVFQSLAENPDWLELDEESRKLIRSQSADRTGLELVEDVDESTVAAMWSALSHSMLMSEIDDGMRARPADRTAFLEGMSKAAETPWLDEFEQFAARTLFTCTFLLYYEDEIENCGSVSELHRWLTDIAGDGKLGEISWLKKFCQRAGLKFRERGRPKNEKT